MSHAHATDVMLGAVVVYFAAVFLLLLLNRDYRDSDARDEGRVVR